MSKFLTTPAYNGKALENQLTNAIISAHDLACGCNNPFDHLQYLIKRATCHSTTEEISTKPEKDTHGDNNDGFDEGDLQALFDASDDAEG